jgi:hypothetical protein
MHKMGVDISLLKENSMITRDEAERFYDGTLPRPVRAAYSRGGPTAVELLRLKGELHFFQTLARSQDDLVTRRRRDGTLQQYMLRDLDLYERKAQNLARILRALEDAR